MNKAVLILMILNVALNVIEMNWPAAIGWFVASALMFEKIVGVNMIDSDRFRVNKRQ